MMDLKKLEQPITTRNVTEFRPHDSVEFTGEHERMIEELQHRGFHNSSFVNNTYEWGEEKGWITERQDSTLRAMHQEHCERY